MYALYNNPHFNDNFLKNLPLSLIRQYQRHNIINSIKSRHNLMNHINIFCPKNYMNCILTRIKKEFQKCIKMKHYHKFYSYGLSEGWFTSDLVCMRRGNSGFYWKDASHFFCLATGDSLQWTFCAIALIDTQYSNRHFIKLIFTLIVSCSS